MYNVCSTVQCTLSAKICQDQVYFMPLCHATFTLAFWMIQNRKMFRLLIFRMTVLLAQSLLSVVKLISINRIWSSLLAQVSIQQTKFNFVKIAETWTLSCKPETRGEAGSEVETWILWKYDEKSVKISDQEKVSSNFILAWLLSARRQSGFCECDKKLLGTFCNVSDFICLTFAEFVWWRQWFKGYLCCG